MLLITIDLLILAGVLLAVVFVVRSVFRKVKEREIEQALFRQQVAEDLAKQVDRLNPEQVLEHERKVNDKLRGLH